MDTKTLVIIPAFNEASVISNTISDLKKYFNNILVVNDASIDNTLEILNKLEVISITHPINLGQGGAIKTGIEYLLKYSDADIVITFDADGQHRVEDVLDMLSYSRRKDCPIVFGSRFLDKRTKPGLKKKVVLKVAVLITRVVTGLNLTDAHNGLRVLRRDALEHVNLIQDRMSHATEIVHQLAATKMTWKEYPVEVLYTDYSKAKGQSVLNSINILFDLIVRT